LQQERKFRGVYNDTAGLTNIDKHIRLFDMPINKYNDDKYSYFSVFRSKTIITFYLTQAILLIIGWIILSGRGEKIWQSVKCFIASITETT
jgi:hypothetical protein